jgi:peroxiredoxin family protein
MLTGERVALVRGERGEVDRRLRIGGQDHERGAVGKAGELAAGADERQRADQPAGVEGSYDQAMIAVILESGEPQRLYTGLSLLVSAAAEGRPARALVGFGALAPLLAERFEAGPDIADRATFTRTLTELRDAALALDECRIYACAAAVEATGIDRALVEARLHGVLSTPRFLRDVAGADLVVV